MICPKCKAEYRNGFSHCSDCDVDLVDHLPQQPVLENQPDSDEMVVVFVAPDLAEVSMVESLLKGGGIDSMVVDENIARIELTGSNAFGGAKVTVPRKQETLAREILREYGGQARQDAGFGRITPFPLEESDTLFNEGDSDRDEPYRCVHCRTLLEPESMVCSNCGATPFRELP